MQARGQPCRTRMLGRRAFSSLPIRMMKVSIRMIKTKMMRQRLRMSSMPGKPSRKRRP